MPARTPLLSVLLLGTSCFCPPPYVDPDACDEEGTLEVTVTPVGPAPWDGFTWNVEESICMLQERDLERATPRILDQHGAEVAVAPFGLCDRWGDPAGLPPGEYTFVGWKDVPTTTAYPGALDIVLRDRPTFEVQPWGRDPSFEPGNVAGGTWVLPSSELDGCDLLPFIAGLVEEHGDLYLRLGEPEDGEVDFDLLWGTLGQVEGARDCRVLSGRAGLSETGELTWRSDHERWDEDPVVEGWNLSLHLGFDGSGRALAGGEAEALVQSTGISLLVADDPSRLCDALGSCETCPDGSGETCLAMEAFGVTGSRSDRAFGDDLPSCWDVLDGDTGDTGSGDTGSGDTGSGDTGSGDTGSGDTGSGDTGGPR